MPATFAVIGGGGITYTFRDAKGANSTLNVNFEYTGTSTLTELKTFADALGVELESLSDAELVRYNINLAMDASGATAAVDYKRVEDKGVIIAQTAAGKNVRFSIPAIKETVLGTDQITIDLANADVTAFTNLIVTGNGTIAPVDSNGSDITSIVEGYLYQRNSLDASRK